MTEPKGQTSGAVLPVIGRYWM